MRLLAKISVLFLFFTSSLLAAEENEDVLYLNKIGTLFSEYQRSEKTSEIDTTTMCWVLSESLVRQKERAILRTYSQINKSVIFDLSLNQSVNESEILGFLDLLKTYTTGQLYGLTAKLADEFETNDIYSALWNQFECNDQVAAATDVVDSYDLR